MAIVQCSNKHFYDNVKFSECPHCKKAMATGIDPLAESKTVAKIPGNRVGALGTFGDTGEQKTIGVLRTTKNVNPIAGWLVCIDGENKGRSFEIHLGKNFAGRSMKMDINLNDESISRDNHFTVIYEPNESQFYLLPGNGLTYYNGKLLSEVSEIKENDKIKAGKSEYIFVPYCKEGREWDV